MSIAGLDHLITESSFLHAMGYNFLINNLDMELPFLTISVMDLSEGSLSVEHLYCRRHQHNPPLPWNLNSSTAAVHRAR